MFQRDYILRMIEMMGELIAAILGLIKKGNYTQAAKSLDNAYHNLLKEDASFFHRIPVDKLTDTLIREHNYTNSHLEVLAELFNAEAELQFAKNNKSDSLPLYEKSLLLFKFLEKENKTYSIDRIKKINHINNQIDTIKSARS